MAHNLEVIGNVASFAFANAVKDKVWWLSASLRAAREFQGTDFALLDGAKGARATFRVEAVKTFLADGREAPCQAVLRTDTGAILSGVGSTWTPVQNVDAIETALAPFYGDDATKIRLQTIGVLDEGRTVFAQTPPLAEIKVGPHKKWEARVAVANSHYSRRIDAILTPTDVVCANTLGAALLGAQEDGTIKRVRHTSGVRGSLAKAGEKLAAELERLHVLAKGAEVALETNLTKDEQVTIVRHLWDAKDKNGEITKAAAVTHDRVLSLSSGEGLIGADEHNPGTAYGLYAAITQYIDRESPRRLSESEKGNKGLADAGRYFRSALGLDPKLSGIRSEATRILLGVGAGDENASA